MFATWYIVNWIQVSTSGLASGLIPGLRHNVKDHAHHFRRYFLEHQGAFATCVKVSQSMNLRPKSELPSSNGVNDTKATEIELPRGASTDGAKIRRSWPLR
jgi:hypothetical protein